MKIKNKLILLLCIFILISFSACSNNENEREIKYKESSLREITYLYPTNYDEDYRNDHQVTYLLNGNEGIITLIRWEGDIKEDISYKGELKEINNIKFYYWIDEDKNDPDDYAVAFLANDIDTGELVEYHIYSEEEEIFWNIVNSIKIKNN